jgi:hypothetical protein
MNDLKKENFFEKYWRFNESYRTLCQEGKIVEATKEIAVDGVTAALNTLYGFNGLGRPLNIAGFVTAAVGGITMISATGVDKVVQEYNNHVREMMSPEAIAWAYAPAGTTPSATLQAQWAKNDAAEEAFWSNLNTGQKIGCGLMAVGLLAIIANKLNAGLDYAIEEKEKRKQLNAIDDNIQAQETPTTTLHSPILLERVAPTQNIAYVG